LLHNYLLHRSGVNTVDHPRRAFSVVYTNAATRSTGDGGADPVVFSEGAPAGGPADFTRVSF